MSLDYTLEEVVNWQEKCYTKPFIAGADNELSLVTMRIIHASTIVDLGKLTTENIGEWMFRLMFAARVAQKEHTGFSYTNLVDHIGLRTNVASQTRHAWVNKVVWYAQEDIIEQVVAALKKLADTPKEIIIKQ